MLYLSSKFSVNSQNREAHFPPVKCTLPYPNLSQHSLPPSIVKALHSILKQEGDKLQGFQLYLVKGGGHRVYPYKTNRERSRAPRRWYGKTLLTLCEG